MIHVVPNYRKPFRRGLSLAESLWVLVVLSSLIGVLSSLMVSLRPKAAAFKCRENLHEIDLAMNIHLTDAEGIYPASYEYGCENGFGPHGCGVQMDGYIHWSFELMMSVLLDDDAFQCPSMAGGGLPRTNPGLQAADWEPDQVDQNGSNVPTELADRQAKRMAYTANAAILPRNKFTQDQSGGPRTNQLVVESDIVNPGRTILMTEFLNDWKSIGTPNSSGTISKSHRPINPFYHVGSGFDEYGAPLQNRGFIYGVPQDQVYYGLLRTAHLAHRTNLINGAQTGVSPVNAVGRHHPTKYSAYERDYGGSANFLMCDGHVESMTVLQSLQQRKWGDRYYSLTGENQILNFDTLD